MPKLAERFDELPLSLRFLVAPLLGLACAVVLVMAFALESERQNSLLQHLASEDLAAFEGLAGASAELASDHTNLFALLYDARNQLDEAQLYDRAKAQIGVIRGLSEQLAQTLAQPYVQDSKVPRIVVLRQMLSEGTKDYISRAFAAIELSTVNLDLAARELVAANASFVEINQQFIELLERARGDLAEKIRGSAEQNRIRVLWLGAVALLLGLCSLLFTLGMTRQLTRTLLGHIDTLMQLGREAGARANAAGKKNVLETMAHAIAAFRETLSKLKRNETLLKQVNDELHQAHAVLEQRVQERTRELQEAQGQLLDAARQAGMAEIATNVLHNVGNVLNSVNISADLAMRQVRASKAQGLTKAMQLINQHPSDLGDFLTRDDKGKLLPAYLNQLDEALQAEQRGILYELEQLTDSINHIKEIVSTQQAYAGASSLLEPLLVSDLIEDALRMNSGALSRHQVKVVKAFAEVPQLLLDKHRLLLILINLISNAKHAMAELAEQARTLTLSVGLADGETLRIGVKDEGEGIAPENLTRIFAHGFTTRQDGHGFGLHSCAVAAMEMGGSLTAHSEGAGKGALFTLDLPCKSMEGTL